MRPTGLYLRYGDGVDAGVNARVHAAARALAASAPTGVLDVVPAYASLYVEFDRDALPARRLRAWLDAPPDDAGAPTGRTVRLPVRYDGPDLGEVAAEADLEPDDVVRRHAGVPYRVYALGFTPGFPFLGEVDATLQRPRHAHPRARVPAHAVAVAGAQTGIYPLPSPGGWRLLGTALQAVYDPRRDPPVLLEPGDTVVFEAGDGPTPPEPEALDLLPIEPEHPRLAVEEAGLLDLVVDRGRFFVGRFGLARSGPLDAPAAALANRLVGNPPDAPLLELNVRGPALRAVAPSVVAVTGAGVVPERNGEALPIRTTVALEAGDVLRFPPAPYGVRGYLALAGGIASERFLGSASVDLRGRIGRPLRAGDVVGAEVPRAAREGFSFRPYAFEPGGSGPVRIRIEPGPQPDPVAFAALTAEPFRVRFGDRMGLQLDGPEVPGGELLSEPTPLGGVQIPPGGRPLVLLHDRGSIGGYAKPAVVLPDDLPKLAQLRPGEELRFVAAGR